MPVLYRDEVAKISLRRLAAEIPPRVLRGKSQVRLAMGPHECEVEIVLVAGVGAVRQRRWFRCPRCGALAGTVGVGYDGVWGCARCLRWRSRRRRMPVVAPPHLSSVKAETAP